jgi:hypothetical protein
MAGRSVRLFLVDGTPQGMRTAEVGNWTGLALVCPRTDLVKLGQREAAHGAGVYLLIGPSEELASRLRVYVGEADDVWARLQNHDTKKDFWTWVVVFGSKDKNLTKAHVRWLEAKLARDIRDAKRADMENGNEPGGGHLPEADTADMEAFLENIRLLLPTLGADVLGAGGDAATAAPALRLELNWEGAHAECLVREGQFVVTKGSTARAKEVPSLSDGYRDVRQKARQDGVLALGGDGLLHFTIDYPFDSPSAAGSMVTGTNVNGRITWKVKGSGVSYKEWQEQQVTMGIAGGAAE